MRLRGLFNGGTGLSRSGQKQIKKQQPMFETLENRQLMSLTIAVREASGAASATVTAGQVLNLELVATVTSANNNASQDGLQDVSGSIISTAVASKAVGGNLAAKNVSPFNASGAAQGTQQDLNEDGNIDVGGTSKTSTEGLFFARSSPLQGPSSGTPANGSLQFVIGSLTYTVTNLNSGGATDINFVPFVSTTPDAAAWLEESHEVDNTNGVFQAGSPFVVTGLGTTAPTGLTGTVIGTAGSYQNDGNTIAKAFDGNLSTFFDGSTANGNWAGLDLGSTYNITQVGFSPRSGWASRMVGGVFQGSNSSTFATGVTTLATITATPATGVYTTLPVTSTGAFRYVRYLSPTGSYGDVAELQFFGTPSTVVVPPPPPNSLTGTVIGTSGSYQNDGNTIAKAFDGNLSTFFDGSTANGNWAGLDLGTTYNITQVGFSPRSGWASRMVGGIFQGSNSSTFATGVTTLATITATPATGVYTTLSVTSTGAFRYVRYLSPNGSYGDVAELQFFGTQVTTTGPTQLTGTAIGTAGSYNNDGNTIAKAFDGNLSTFFDGPTANGNWAGLDLGTAQTITQISYAPRSGWASRMVGGMFQASNSANFSTGVVNLYTVTTTPTVGVLTTVSVNVAGTYRYVRYLSPNGSFGDVAEIAFYG